MSPRRHLRTVLSCSAAALALVPVLSQAALYVTVIQGLGGQSEYERQFTDSRSKIEAASLTITDADKLFSFSGDAATREAILAHFKTLTARMNSDDRAAIYLVGHGSFDGDTYKFNIPGVDLTAADFKTVLDALPGRNHFLVNTSSTSGALVQALLGTDEKASNPNYVIIAATRNGIERNATQFGRFFAEALSSASADTNKNQSVSIQEAFDYAQRAVEAYFKDAGRLATEHAQLRGDGAAQFNLSRLNTLQIAAELSVADNELRTLLEQRQAINGKIEDLQLRRAELDNATYLQQLQTLILQTAQLTEQIDALQKNASNSNSNSNTDASTAPAAEGARQQ
ncbi:MAG: hypothetical protein LBF16_00445 [Pseudomonadales bacterium]|nr:hypothetical protein [Pseudomonadales bacterium]